MDLEPCTESHLSFGSRMKRSSEILMFLLTVHLGIFLVINQPINQSSESFCGSSARFSRLDFSALDRHLGLAVVKD